MTWANARSTCRTSFTTGQKMWMTVWAFRFRDAVARGWLPGANNDFDIYEPDNAAVAARPILDQQTQVHTFHDRGRLDVDWVSFQYPATGSLVNYQVVVTNITGGAVQSVQFFQREDGTEGDALTNVTMAVVGNTTTYTIPCTSMVPGNVYLIRLNKGANNSRYSIRLLGSTTNNPSVAGPSSFCTSNNVTYTLQNRPAGTSVTWTRSSNIAQVSGQGTDTYVVRANTGAAGTGCVRATINGSCASTVLTRSVQVGAFAQTQIGVTGTAGVCPGHWYTYEAIVPGGHQAGYTYQWSWPSNWFLQSQSQNRVTLSAPSYAPIGGGVVGVRVNNGCGLSSPTSGLTVYPGYGCTSYSYTISPNPVEGILTVEAIGYDESGTFKATDTEYEVELVTDAGEKTMTGKSDCGVVKMDTRSLRKGLYLLRIQHQDEWIVERVILK